MEEREKGGAQSGLVDKEDVAGLPVEFKLTSSTETPRELIELIVVYPAPLLAASLRLIRHVRLRQECKSNDRERERERENDRQPVGDV